MPRRHLRSVLIALLALTLLAGAGVPAIAQDATPAAGAVPDVVLAWIDAWNAADSAAIAALYTADGVYEDVPTNHTLTGDEIEPALVEYLGGLSDVSVELTNAYGGDGWAVAEWTLSATNQGLFPDAPGSTETNEPAPTGSWGMGEEVVGHLRARATRARAKKRSRLWSMGDTWCMGIIWPS